MAVKGAAKLRPLAKTPGAQFEISIDGTPRAYRDRKTFAIEAAERLKRKHPNSEVVVKNLQTGEATKIKYKPDLGRADIQTERPIRLNRAPRRVPILFEIRGQRHRIRCRNSPSYPDERTTS